MRGGGGGPRRSLARTASRVRLSAPPPLLGLLLALLLLPSAVQAVTPPGLVASAWCPVYTAEPEEGDPKCDVGLGLALKGLYHRRLFLVATVGTTTAGGGLAWVASRGEHPLAVGLLVIAPYDERGLAARRWSFALGATFGFGAGD